MSRPRRSRRRLHFLVTAGPTREPLDDVRFLSNASSGRLGFAVAAAAALAGHRVTLVAGPVALRPPAGVKTVPVVTALEMRDAVRAAFPSADALVMTAAVSDHRPARRRRGKEKKGASRVLLPLVRNPDIVAEAGRKKGARVVVGFAVEVAGALSHARRKLREKRLDALCLCSPAAFEASSADYRFLLPGGTVEVMPGVPKAALARRIVEFVENNVDGRAG